jgi:2-dehydropantoate 2-reductase
VVLLQNGVGFQESVRLTLPAARVFSAVTTEGAFLEAELCVRHAGRGHTQLGLHPRAEAATAAALATELSGGGLAVEPVADIEAALWRKLAVNCAINPLTALHGCRNGRLLEDCVLYAEFSALCTELETVFAGLGRGAIARTLRDQASAVARATANNRSSMLQDLEAHRETEIDFITGQLCRVARGAGIPCPRNESLLADVRRRARASA